MIKKGKTTIIGERDLILERKRRGDSSGSIKNQEEQYFGARIKRRSRSTSNLFPLDPKIEITLHRARKELEVRYKTERELDILVQPQPTMMAGLSHEDSQRHIQNFLEITDTYNYPNVSKDYVRLLLFPFSLLGEAKEWLQKELANSIYTWDYLAKKFLIKFFPTKKTKSLRSQILGFQQRNGETIHQAWERYKKLLRDCPHHCQTDEVLGHTFVGGLDETSKMNLDSACGGSCMARPYNEIQLLLNNFTANDYNWQGEEEPRRAMKQKAARVLELDDFSAMRVDIAKLANQMNRMTMNYTQQMQYVQQMSIYCEMCGDNHTSDMCPTNPESIYYVGQQSRGPMNQQAQYGNTYNPDWRNHPNFSWGGNQSNQNQYRSQGNFNQPQRPPQQVEESTNDLSKKLLHDNQQLRTDFRNLERQMGQLAANQNTRPTDALPSDTKKNPQVSSITVRTGRELGEVPKKRKEKLIPEGELIPKATQEAKKDDTVSAPVNVLRPPPHFPQRLQKKNDDRMFNKFLSMLSNVGVGHALCYLGASINLMPLSLYKNLGLGAPKPTTVMLQLADRAIAYPERVIENVLLKIGKFIFPADFIILDFEVDEKVPIILGRLLLATGDAITKEELSIISVMEMDELLIAPSVYLKDSLEKAIVLFESLEINDEVEEMKHILNASCEYMKRLIPFKPLNGPNSPPPKPSIEESPKWN
ncbi:uncharacterized protein [Nicotiana sylvestris]|uniref:uncharacterized protein n=1 Tax=Nicotiana sylvestris TaxID=4096 RepID=UPI00388C4267